MRVKGDWAGYGQALDELAVTLQRLERMATGQTPSVVPDEVEDTNEGSEEIAQ